MIKGLPNYGRENLLDETIRTSLRALMSDTKGEGAGIISGEEKYVNRVLDLQITLGMFEDLSSITKRIGVTKNFKEVIDYFKVPADETPPGFRIEYQLEKVTDIGQILSFGVMMTPALVVDGKVKVMGKAPSPDEIRRLLA